MRLYPAPNEELAAEDVYSDLSFPDSQMGGGSPKTPYVVVNMVSTLDGRVSSYGKASPIGGAVDRLLMRNIRCAVDAVLVGAGTVRAEEMNLGVPQPLSEKRRATGLSGQPLGVILAGSKELPLDRKLFCADATNLVVFAGEVATKESLRRASQLGARVFRSDGSDYPDPAEVLRMLREELGVRRLLVEGGPTINRVLFSSNLVDELFLTLSPKISGSGGAEPSLTAPNRADKPFINMRLTSVYSSPEKGELYLRYAS
jgi:riboflavin-specific deaminase-like protein